MEKLMFLLKFFKVNWKNYCWRNLLAKLELRYSCGSTLALDCTEVVCAIVGNILSKTFITRRNICFIFSNNYSIIVIGGENMLKRARNQHRQNGESDSGSFFLGVIKIKGSDGSC